ncbi:MAG: hypothetical protein KC912_24640 [Proteobacteria bacterium]|nr:hypothetical protein [Pseudomonadota bacterium]
MPALWLLALIACSDDAPVEVVPDPQPIAVVAPVPDEVHGELADTVAFEVDAAHAETLKGSPVLAASYTSVIEALNRPAPAVERVARVAALREKALQDVPAEDGASTSLRSSYEVAVDDALGAFFVSYAHHILEGAASSDDKSTSLAALEMALMQSEWDWNLAVRDVVQAKLMMASRGL